MQPERMEKPPLMLLNEKVQALGIREQVTIRAHKIPKQGDQKSVYDLDRWSAIGVITCFGRQTVFTVHDSFADQTSARHTVAAKLLSFIEQRGGGQGKFSLFHRSSDSTRSKLLIPFRWKSNRIPRPSNHISEPLVIPTASIQSKDQVAPTSTPPPRDLAVLDDIKAYFQSQLDRERRMWNSYCRNRRWRRIQDAQAITVGGMEKSDTHGLAWGKNGGLQPLDIAAGGR